MSGSSKDHPILGLELTPVNSGDKERLQTALAEIVREDPSISTVAKPESAGFIIEGKSESHLDSICDRLRDQYRVRIKVGSPMAILLETIRKTGEAEGKYIRQTGGSSNYGHCWLRVEPNEPDRGYEFINSLSGDMLPDEYVRSIERGALSAMEAGILGGHPLVDMKVTLIGGSYHPEDSNPNAFEVAASMALRDAARNASPILLEPVMALEIEIPEELSAALCRSAYEHRGRVEDKTAISSVSGIRAIVPLSELLLSDFLGLADFPIEFAGFEPKSDNGSDDENGPGVTANKPDYPRRGKSSATAQPDPEDE